MVAPTEFPKRTSSSAPTLSPARVLDAGAPATLPVFHSPGTTGALTRRHLALPISDFISIFGITVSMVFIASVDKASWPSFSSRDLASCFSKSAACSATSSCVCGPLPSRPKSCMSVGDCEIRTRPFCHLLARPLIMARMSGLTREMSRVGSRADSGSKIILLGWSRSRFAVVANRFTLPVGSRTVPEGLICSGSALPLRTMSPCTPKLKSSGLFTLSSGPSTMFRLWNSRSTGNSPFCVGGGRPSSLLLTPLLTSPSFCLVTPSAPRSVCWSRDDWLTSSEDGKGSRLSERPPMPGAPTAPLST
mmetsp:Transcript_13353/g.46186  ORF Transcript_13353/g.46186 Transcript_13353/m.46186 type:complete len:305 (+) Transcript_13353:212-1126(+)